MPNYSPPVNSGSAITNGENQSSESEHDNCNLDNHALNSDHEQGAEAQELNSQEERSGDVRFKSIAIQTSDDEILSAIRELAEKCNKLESVVEDPKNGISCQLAKTQRTVTELYSDINGAVSGLKVQMQTVIKTAKENSEKIVQMEDCQKRMAAMLGENKRMMEELKVMQGLVQKMAQQTRHPNKPNFGLDQKRYGTELDLTWGKQQN